MIIKGNDKFWSQTEKKEILNLAVENQLEKRRKVRIAPVVAEDEETTTKKRPTEQEDTFIVDSSDSSVSSGSATESD